MAPHTDVETTAQPIITDLLARICNFTAEADMSIGSAALQYTADYMFNPSRSLSPQRGNPHSPRALAHLHSELHVQT
jgi:hypothetical protein